MSRSKKNPCRSDAVYGVYGVNFAPYTARALENKGVEALCTVCTVFQHTHIYRSIYFYKLAWLYAYNLQKIVQARTRA